MTVCSSDAHVYVEDTVLVSRLYFTYFLKYFAKTVLWRETIVYDLLTILSQKSRREINWLNYAVGSLYGNVKPGWKIAAKRKQLELSRVFLKMKNGEFYKIDFL